MERFTLTAKDKDYEHLFDCPEPPNKLRIEGRGESSLLLLKHLPLRGLTIVGTRRPQPRNLRKIREWVRSLQGQGLIIVSGLATGIDAAAHEAALDYSMYTVAILGTSLDRDYPKRNRFLRKRILNEGGLIISEILDGESSSPSNFTLRNRLLAAWSQATLVIEAAKKSGALSTARWAREMDRRVFAVPCYPGDTAMAGNQTLIDRDHAIPFWSPRSLGCCWLHLSNIRRRKRRRGAELNIFEETIYELLLEVEPDYGGGTTEWLHQRFLQKGYDSRDFFNALDFLYNENMIYLLNDIWYVEA